MDNSAVFDSKTGKYSRYFTSEMLELSDKIKTIYNSNHAYVFNSGINANSIAIDILMSKFKESVLIYPSNSYYENIEIIQYKKEMYKLEIYEFDILDTVQLFNILQNPKHKILLIESCINPYGYIFDFSLFCKIKRHNTSIIVDNTWLSGYIFNPLYCGADIVTESMTKYYAANSEIAGCCAFNNNYYYKLLDDYVRFTGIHISLNVIRTINNKINDTITRLHKISECTIKTINYFLKNNIICIHPCLNNHPSYNNYYKYFNSNYYVGTFLIGFNNSQTEIKEMMKKIKTFEIKSSFCYHKTIINKSIYKIKTSDLNFIRISMGYNDDFDRIQFGINELIYILS
jgi:cystathionine beta-lyase/cystathionine gamma-synthase